MKRAIVLSISLAFSSLAAAQPYVAVEASNSRIAGDSTFNSNVAAGFSFGKLSVEAGTYQSIDRRVESSTIQSPVLGSFDHTEWATKGYRVSARFQLPVTQRLSAYGMASAYRLRSSSLSVEGTSFDHDANPLTPRIVNSTLTYSERKDTVPGYALGVSYAPTPEIELYLQGERIETKAGMISTDSGHITQAAFGLRWKF